MTRYFTSDQHFGHTNVIKYCNRPFATVEEMNEILINNWNSIVKPEDEVIVVGDFSMSFKAVELYTKRLVGKKILVPGNHDFSHPANKKSRTPEGLAKWTQNYLDNGWAEVHQKMELNLPDVGLVNIAHLPYKGQKDGDDNEGYEERHTKHRLEDDGKILIAGHVHQTFKHKFTSKGSLMVNVGVDVWDFKPISEAKLIEYILCQKK